jgi:hypothetical protein
MSFEFRVSSFGLRLQAQPRRNWLSAMESATSRPLGIGFWLSKALRQAPAIFLWLAGGLWSLDSALWTCSAQQTNAPGSKSYSSFDVILKNNIFDPRRYRYTPRSQPKEYEPRVQREWFALVGILNSDKGPVAFFDGSSPRYSDALKLGEQIGGFTVADVQPSYVRLSSPSNQVELKMGMDLRRESEGPWRMGDGSSLESLNPEPPPNQPTTNLTVAAVTSPDGAPPEGDDPTLGDAPPDNGGTNAIQAIAETPPTDPVLRRLWERRQQENGR